MSDWRALVDQALQPENTRNTSNTRVESGASVPSVPSVPADPVRLLRDWHGKLRALDFDRAPACMDLRRWRNLCEDCWWLYETHASRLVRDGWSAADLWGVLPANPMFGGLALRIDGARRVLFDDSGQAFWSHRGVKFSTYRGAGDQLVRSGLVMVWKLTA